MCKHFINAGGYCSKGSGCHFAHGESELRRNNEGGMLPPQDLPMKLNLPYNNYKTQKCKFYEDVAKCRFGKNCTYAHTQDELRQPFEELPVEVSNSSQNIALAN